MSKPPRVLALMRLAIAGIFLHLLPAERAHAFDMGHHLDLTRQAFIGAGFNSGSDAILAAQVANWLTDYYSGRPTLDSDGNALRQLKRDMPELHFDSLTSTAEVRYYWSRLSRNTQTAIVDLAEQARDAPNEDERSIKLMQMLAIIGMTLHAVQDFYSHSNWSEIFTTQPGIYRATTWFDVPNPSNNIRTGLSGPNGPWPTGDPNTDHGDYDRGMNHDSYNRPGWAEAYVHAYAASRQWLDAVENWISSVSPDAWTRILTYQANAAVAAELIFDLENAYQLSLWVASNGKDGAWKGRGSGSLEDFAPTAVRYELANSTMRRIFADGRVYSPITADLAKRNIDPGPAPAVPSVTLALRAIEVRTIHVRAIDSPDSFICGAADYNAILTISGLDFVEPTQQGSDAIEPEWHTIQFVPLTESRVLVNYALIDEDRGVCGASDVIDINPAIGQTALKFEFDPTTHQLSGDVSGTHDSVADAVSVGGEGENDRAVVRFYVTERPLNPSLPP